MARLRVRSARGPLLPSVPRPERQSVCGFGAIERTIEHGRMFFALYRSRGTVIFQAGPQSCVLNTSGVRFEHRLRTDERSSESSGLHDGRLAFACSYRHALRATMARLTRRDNTDFEHDYFLRHTRRNLAPPVPDRGVWQDAEAGSNKALQRTDRPAAAFARGTSCVGPLHISIVSSHSMGARGSIPVVDRQRSKASRCRLHGRHISASVARR